MNDIFKENPTSLQEAVDLLLTLDDASETAQGYSRARDFIAAHHADIGRTIRNRWGLWKGAGACKIDEAPLYYWFFAKGLRHPDDISGCVLKALWFKVKARDYDLIEDIEHYNRHWTYNNKRRFENINKIVEETLSNYEPPQIVTTPAKEPTRILVPVTPYTSTFGIRD